MAVQPTARRLWHSIDWALTCTALVYVSIVLLAVLTLNPYFAQTWDVATFLQAAHRFLDGGNPSDLYAQSRAAQTWPYAYPPLHAFVVALALLIGNILHLLPDYVWARVPAMIGDLGVAWALYRIVGRSANAKLAHLAFILWLFNPITFYDTAVQGHFEAEWLFFVLLAYIWYDESQVLLAAAALAVATLFKQTALLFSLPFWIAVLLERSRRRQFLPSVALYIVIGGIVCLPFLLYSNDFLYSNLTYVENVPVQTQSWIVALLGWTRTSGDALSSDFFLLRYQTLVTMLLSLVIAFVGIRRGWDAYLIGALIALAFFLTSKKVMGYYYVMLWPFLLATCLPKRRYGWLLVTLIVVSWISLSPYYAAWVDHAHWWIYALLGSLNSLFFLILMVQLIRDRGSPVSLPEDETGLRAWTSSSSLLVVSLGLTAGAAFAAFLQPIFSSTSSPIRPPIVAAGLEGPAILAFLGLVVLICIATFAATRWARSLAPGPRSRAAWGIVLAFAPLFFAVYTLTKESTAIFELALKALGV